MTKKRAAVIGAGASGLPSARWALAYDFEPVVFEAQSESGGLWRFKEDDGEWSTVMRSTVINTSKEMTAYSDYPPKATDPNYMHNRKLLQYLRDYADHHGVTKHIRFNHRVENVVKASDYDKTGRWVVHFTDGEGNKKQETFEAVLCCTGHHAAPKLPSWPGQENFQGRILHSKQYKDPRGFEGHNVLVVGVGNSGMDICSELARIAYQVYMCTRRGVWIITRVVDEGVPVDMWINKRINHYLRQVLPAKFYPWMFERKLQQIFDHDKYGLRPKHSAVSQHVSMSDDIHGRICTGQVRVVPNVKEFTKNGVIFENGEEIQVDDVVLATGYLFDFPLLDGGKLIPSKENNVRVYKNMFPPQEAGKNTLAVIGLAQPIGSLMPISEIQARLFFAVQAGEVKLPNRQGMEQEIDQKLNDLHDRYVKVSRHTIQVDYTAYMCEISDMFGAVPKPLDYLFTDPKLCYKLIFGPDVPYNYRLSGSKPWSGAREAILGVEERYLKGLQPSKDPKSFKKSNNNLYTFAGLVLFASIVFIWLFH
ncbi:Dimethylaniline monooxygenase [N-oxide-forming] [Aphelenchoides bicaudatus]|nr:Dimethylaniline monooxygenase [N-oxide-forming] [Aphelenchoides bicaudatus]